MAAGEAICDGLAREAAGSPSGEAHAPPKKPRTAESPPPPADGGGAGAGGA